MELCHKLFPGIVWVWDWKYFSNPARKSAQTIFCRRLPTKNNGGGGNSFPFQLLNILNDALHRDFSFIQGKKNGEQK